MMIADIYRNNNLLQYLLFFAILIFTLEHLASVAEVKLNVVSDAAGYLGNSKIPFFSIDYWFSMRPVGYPTFIKFMQSNPNLVAAMQSLLHIASWSFFSFYLYIKSRNKLFGFLSGLTVLFIAMQPDIALWTHHVLTESLTFSFIAWILILIYEFLISEKKRYFYILLFILVSYSTIRDVNAFYVVTFIVAFAMFYFYKYINKIIFIVSSILLISTLFFSTYTANHAGNSIMNKRWMFPYFNLFGHRFLTNPELLQSMKIEGMPINEALLRKKNVWASGKDTVGQGWYDDPELKEFRDWVVKSGKSKYTKFLITHPSYTFGEIYLNRHTIFHYTKAINNAYYLKGYKIDNIFTYTKMENITFYIYLSLLIAIIILLSFILRKNIFNKYTMPMLTLLLPIGLLAIITFHGDAMEVHRHTLIVPILLKTTLFMIAYIFANELFTKKPVKCDKYAK